MPFGSLVEEDTPIVGLVKYQIFGAALAVTLDRPGC